VTNGQIAVGRCSCRNSGGEVSDEAVPPPGVVLLRHPLVGEAGVAYRWCLRDESPARPPQPRLGAGDRAGLGRRPGLWRGSRRRRGGGVMRQRAGGWGGHTPPTPVAEAPLDYYM
jgi:hypothetical protein